MGEVESVYIYIIHTFLKHKISCHIVHDHPELEVCAIFKPRGRAAEDMLKTEGIVHYEIKSLHSELTSD